MVKDFYHDTTRHALEKEDWFITHDPLTIKLSKRNIFIDLGAERVFVAEKGLEKIAVEVKSFLGLSILTEFYKALGQYQVYTLAIRRRFPEYQLFLAMPEESYLTLLSDDILAEFLTELSLKLIIFNPVSQKIVKWIR